MTALTWRLLLPVWKTFISTRNQNYASDTSRNPLQSCLVFHSILDILLKIFFWADVYSSYYIILSYLVKNSIQRNMNRRGEKRAGSGREKSPSFTKITRLINQLHWRANNHYIYLENRWERFHTLICKIKLSRSWNFDNDSDFVQFLTSTDVWIRKYSSMFGFPWKNPLMNSLSYIRKWVLWYG